MADTVTAAMTMITIMADIDTMVPESQWEHPPHAATARGGCFLVLQCFMPLSDSGESRNAEGTDSAVGGDDTARGEKGDVSEGEGTAGLLDDGL